MTSNPSRSLPGLLIGIVIGALITVILDIGGVRLKEMLQAPALLEISNTADSSVSVQVRDSVLLLGPEVAPDEKSRMILPHVGLFEVSVIRPDGSVFAKHLVAIDADRKAHIVIDDEKIFERQ